MNHIVRRADQIPPQIVPSKPTRKARERIQLMETRPQEDWFQSARDPWGREVWFLRVQMTGLRPRRYGPFATKHRGLLFLDRLLDVVGSAICNRPTTWSPIKYPAAPLATGQNIIQSWKTN